jgi:hypothetical protein
MSVTFKTKDGASVTVDEEEINTFNASLFGSFIVPSEKEAYGEATLIW